MNFSIILANPGIKSFNHAIAQTAREILQSQNISYFYHDLYQESFPPVLEYSETKRNAILPSIISQHCEEIKSVDGIIIVHPNWWGQPPAILKGWIDRVIRPEVAYRFVENDKGEGVPEGLLKAHIGVVFNTANTLAERELQVFGDPLQTIWKNCVFGLCGVNNFVRKTFSVMITSTPDMRKDWLNEVRDTTLKAIDDVRKSIKGYHTEDHGFTEL
jgi:putative NADPH-quinone reductase